MSKPLKASNILPKWILSSYPQRTHTPRTPREKRTDINIYLITHTYTQNKSSSEIVFVVLRLHCQLKVVPEGPSLILSKSGIEHAEETFRRARVGGVWRTTLRARLSLPWPAHAAPRSSPLFALRPRSTWVSLRTARQVVKPNVEELRARPAHKDHRSGAGARDAGRPDPQLWCARAHTQAPAHRDACGRLTRNLRSCPTLRLPPRPVFPFNAVSDS